MFTPLLIVSILNLLLSGYR